MVEITKDTIIGDILDVAPQTAPIFFGIGMHCLPRVPRRDRGGGLRRARRGRGQAPCARERGSEQPRRGITGQAGRRIRSYAPFSAAKEVAP